MQNPQISIVCPVFNEENVLDKFCEIITQTMVEIHKKFEIIFINDGSTDNTLEVLFNLQKQYNIQNGGVDCHLIIANLSRNFGKEAALSAGISIAKGDAVIPIDADLQDPPVIIKDLISKYDKGYDVVLARRIDRYEDSIFKRLSALMFYKIHNKISDIQIPQNVGDFRLFSQKVAKYINQMPENQRFMKGIFAYVGFKYTFVDYKRDKRFAGQSKFNGWKLWNFALNGITSFSTLPLRIWTYIGFICSFLAFIYGSFIILKYLITGADTPGYASLIVSILFIGGLQLIGIGVLGEYIGRIYMESKRRPPYIIDQIYGE